MLADLKFKISSCLRDFRSSYLLLFHWWIWGKEDIYTNVLWMKSILIKKKKKLRILYRLATTDYQKKMFYVLVWPIFISLAKIKQLKQQIKLKAPLSKKGTWVKKPMGISPLSSHFSLKHSGRYICKEQLTFPRRNLGENYTHTDTHTQINVSLQGDPTLLEKS